MWIHFACCQKNVSKNEGLGSRTWGSRAWAKLELVQLPWTSSQQHTASQSFCSVNVICLFQFSKFNTFFFPVSTTQQSPSSSTSCSKTSGRQVTFKFFLLWLIFSKDKNLSSLSKHSNHQRIPFFFFFLHVHHLKCMACSTRTNCPVNVRTSECSVQQGQHCCSLIPEMSFCSAQCQKCQTDASGLVQGQNRAIWGKYLQLTSSKS